MVAEAARLRAAVLAGRLDERGDTAATERELRPIIEAVNATMDAHARPIGAAVDYVSRVVQGETPPPIEDAWEGDFRPAPPEPERLR